MTAAIARGCLAAGISFGLGLALLVFALYILLPDPSCPPDQDVWVRLAGKAPVARCFSDADGSGPEWHPPPTPAPSYGGP